MASAPFITSLLLWCPDAALSILRRSGAHKARTHLDRATRPAHIADSLAEMALAFDKGYSALALDSWTRRATLVQLHYLGRGLWSEVSLKIRQHASF